MTMFACVLIFYTTANIVDALFYIFKNREYAVVGHLLGYVDIIAFTVLYLFMLFLIV